MRRPAVFHCTSQPLHFFGRRDELALLDRALSGTELSVVAFVGPGGQGKTAIMQHWLQTAGQRVREVDGLFFWSFYRGKDSDLCLRELYGYAEGMDQATQASASFCVDRLLPRLRQERWAIVLDGTEVVQHEQGSWRGRFVHPELGRLLEELAGAAMPGLLVLTTRFPVPMLETRRHARILSLATLDLDSGRRLLQSLGVQGLDAEVAAAAQSCGLHAKAVELLGTYLWRYRAGQAAAAAALPAVQDDEASDEERHVARVLAGFQAALTQEEKDVLALATAFRQPPLEAQFIDYLQSKPVRHLLHDVWQRSYPPFAGRDAASLARMTGTLVELRLLERVDLALSTTDQKVLDAHPLVRRGFEDVLGAGGAAQGARSRAGFLRGRPDRRPPETLEEAREEVEMFHAYCDAGLWSEADRTLVALDNPKHRFVAPAFERDLLLRFFPHNDWRQPPLWPGFGRHRSLAICLEMLGQFAEACEVYRPADAALRGDALIALGRLDPILQQTQAAAPWQTLWQAYRTHALALAGRKDEALHAAQTLVPSDIYEWVHLFEALVRIERLDLLEVRSLLYRPPLAEEHAWAKLARRRMAADYEMLRGEGNADLENTYRELIEAYDRGGLPWERALTRLRMARWLFDQQRHSEGKAFAQAAAEIARRYEMALLLRDALKLAADNRL